MTKKQSEEVKKTKEVSKYIPGNIVKFEGKTAVVEGSAKDLINGAVDVYQLIFENGTAVSWIRENQLKFVEKGSKEKLNNLLKLREKA